MMFRVLFILMAINIIALLLTDKQSKRYKKLLTTLFLIIIFEIVTVAVYFLFPEDKLAAEFFRSGPGYQQQEPEKILIDRYEIVSLSDTKLNNMLSKRSTSYSLELFDIKPDHTQKLYNIIKDNKYIHTLKLNRLNKKAATNIYKSLNGNTSIRTIQIYNCLECLHSMNDEITWPENMDELYISNTQIDIEAAQNISASNGIDKLGIRKCALSTNNLTRIINRLPNNQKIINLSHNKLNSTSVDILIQWLESNKELEVLDISYNKIAEPGLIKLIEKISKNPNIKKIIISKNLITKDFDEKIEQYKDIVENTVYSNGLSLPKDLKNS